MNLFTKTAIASIAVIATAIVPVTGAMAASKHVPPSGYSYKGGPYYYKKGPKVHYPRGYYKHKPPVIVHKGKNNGAALGLLGFAAGAALGSALSR